MKKHLFSGIKPSGDLHLGNYLGAILNWTKLQNKYDSIFCVVDLHAITVPQNPEMLRKRTIEIAKIYFASGIDPKKSTIFIQSHIPEHTELAWILNTIAKIPELEKMTQFKDKSAKEGRESANVGLFDYPILMASDILLYDTQIVPVGEDQLQHIELARTLAKRFNKRFGETFFVPEAYIQKEGMRIMALDNPQKKMSKSSQSEYSYISLLDSPDIVQKKIKKAVTDSGKEIIYNENKPALKNLINIYSLLDNKKPEEIEKLFIGKDYAEFKKKLAEVIIKSLEPFQKRIAELSDETVLKILKEGAARVRSLAKKKLLEVKKKIGFVI